MTAAIDLNMQYMQTHGVFIPEVCWLNTNNKHCLTHNMLLQYHISNHVEVLPSTYDTIYVNKN
jgi:hypothetical protein